MSRHSPNLNPDPQPHNPSRLTARLLDRHRRGPDTWNVDRVGAWSIQNSFEALVYDWFNELLTAPTFRTLGVLAFAVRVGRVGVEVVGVDRWSGRMAVPSLVGTSPV